MSQAVIVRASHLGSRRSSFRITSYRLFYFFCGLIYPCIAFGAVYLSYRTHVWFGALTALILIAWVYHSFATTCRRCQFYGTAKCGIPGLVVPYFFAKRPVVGLPHWRIWANYYADLGLMVYFNAIYLFHPPLGLLVGCATFIVWRVIYRPKRFHGLMHVIRDRPMRSQTPDGSR
jgi:hypothetical protein